MRSRFLKKMGNLKIGYEIVKAKLFHKRFPLFVSWEITNRCNTRCKYCNIPDRSRDELDTSQMLSIVDDLARCGTKRIHLTGGEPLLREDLGIIIAHIYNKEISISIATNGILLPQTLSWLREKVDTLTISLDGPEEVHNELRGKQTYEKAITALELAVKNRMNVILATVLTKINANLDCIRHILDIAERFNIKVFFQPVANFPNKRNNPLFPSITQYRQVLEYLIKRKKKDGRAGAVGNSLSALYYLFRWPARIEMRNCVAGNISCRIQSNGEVYPCDRKSDQLVLNSVQVGIKQAFSYLRKKDFFCSSCWCANMIELNYIWRLNIEVIYNAFHLTKQRGIKTLC